MNGSRFFSALFGAYLMVAVLLSASPLHAAGQGQVTLDADRVVYDQESGVAEAQGAVHLRNEEIQIFADWMEYHTEDQKAYGSADTGRRVVIHYGVNKFTGDAIEYDLVSREGVLTNASGDIPAGMAGGVVHLRGRNLEVAPFDMALEKQWMKKRRGKGATGEEQFVAKWEDVGLTTCAEENPHYQLTTKRLLVIPGVRVIARTPRVYIGGKFLFTYPFDYVVPLREKEKLLGIFTPSVVYDFDKGVGYALSGPYAWDTGAVHMAFRYWSKVDFETRIGVTQRLGQSVSAFAWWDYSYDKDLKEKESRTAWGLNTGWRGWTASLVWSRNESLEIVKNFGDTYRNVLHRMPEFSVSSPWYRVGGVPDFSWRVRGYWGDYETRRPVRGAINSSSRMVGDLQAQYVVTRGDIRPFWKGWYRYFSYSEANARGDDRQEIFSSWLGVRTHIGDVDLAACWFVQDVTGRSPMSWDRASDREVFYGEMGLPLGKNLYVSALAAYDLKRSRMGEMGYRLALDYDCTRWELVYRDDMVGNDDWVSLRFVVKAFPETPYVFGDKKLSNPFPSQGTFKKGASAEPSIRPEEREGWGDDGLTGRSDPTLWDDTETLDSTSSQESPEGTGSEN